MISPGLQIFLNANTVCPSGVLSTMTTATLLPTEDGRFTREALLSEAGFEKVFRTQNWVR